MLLIVSQLHLKITYPKSQYDLAKVGIYIVLSCILSSELSIEWMFLKDKYC